MTQYWFKPKTFGYGATPITWEGWALVAGFSLVILGCVVAMLVRKDSLAIWASSMAVIVVATVVLIAVSLNKTDGAWGWNAGTKKFDGKNN